jgi:predicted DNA-binding ribbon-helix-helix protein
MKSAVVKRSIVVAGHETGVSLEEAFWNGMKEISALRNMTLSEPVGETDGNHQQGNLSSAIRLFVRDDFKKRARISSGERSHATSAGPRFQPWCAHQSFTSTYNSTRQT